MANDNCDSCGLDYDFDPKVDGIILYPLLPRFNHVRATCPHCTTVSLIFVEIDSLMNHAKLLPVKLFDTAHASVVNLRESLEPETPEPEPLWLSPRSESYIRYFHDQLERGEME